MASYICNAFSINMIAGLGVVTVKYIPTDPCNIPKDVISAIGHADIANIISRDLGVKLEPNRINNKLAKGETIYVAQYTGPRLPEGAISLPEGAEIVYYEVKVLED